MDKPILVFVPNWQRIKDVLDLLLTQQWKAQIEVVQRACESCGQCRDEILVKVFLGELHLEEDIYWDRIHADARDLRHDLDHNNLAERYIA